MKRIFPVLVFLIILSAHNGVGAQQQTYDKHFLVLVDQTIKGPVDDVRRDLSNFFLGRPMQYNSDNSETIPTDLMFNPSTDKISLFAFAIPTKDYLSIKQNYVQTGKSEKKYYEEVCSHLIHPDKVYIPNQTNINSFVGRDLSLLFSSNHPVRNDVNTLVNGIQRSVSLSHYIYPAILNFFDQNCAAKKYILILVSDFVSGSGSAQDTEDQRRITELSGENNVKYIQAFYKSLNEKKKNFSKNDRCQINWGANSIAAIFSTISSQQAVDQNPASITSNINLQETKYASKKFDMDEVSIHLNSADLLVNRISLSILRDGEVIYCKDPLIELVGVKNCYNSDKGEYTIPSQKAIELPIYQDDELLFRYTFLATNLDQNGNPVMSIKYDAERNIIVNDNIFVPAPQEHIVRDTILVVMGILLLVSFLIWFYYQRGKREKLSIDIKILPISRARYMDVSNLKVTEYDCWYKRDVNDDEREIPVNFVVHREKKRFAKRYECEVEYSIVDIDANYDFSFRPIGNEPNGMKRVSEKKYILVPNPDGFCETGIVVYVEHGKTPNLERDNILEVQVTATVNLKDKKGNVLRSCSNEQIYRFIVKPYFEEQSTWVSFDPGTTGSCIAFGANGLPVSTDNIMMARIFAENTAGEKVWQTTFPSKVIITPSSKLFDHVAIEDLKDGSDFVSGIRAQQLWRMYPNRFQSIKKLLGYNDTFSVTSKSGVSINLAGEDIAHLLVKGLQNRLQDYLQSHSVEDDSNIKRLLPKKEVPPRAIVAVPNNYTLVKVQSMVETIKRLNVYKEVHYIYEAEAVMMNYFRSNWSVLDELKAKTFIVYDMGGATINMTAFKLKVYTSMSRGNKKIDSIEVQTIAKVGYYVGGDDIDFAIIKTLYGIPSIKESLKEMGVTEKDHMSRHKTELIDTARALKIWWIERQRQGDNLSEDNALRGFDSFWSYLHSSQCPFVDINLDAQISNKDKDYLQKQLPERRKSNLEKYVFSNVEDASKELMADIKNADVEIIFSGRSVLYPGIIDRVISVIKGKQCSVHMWEGLCSDGLPDAEKVKTAVAEGGCWYAMFKHLINLDHNIVTASFGFKDMKNGKLVFHPIVCRNQKLSEDGYFKSVVEPWTDSLPSLEFLQMLGSNANEILDKDIKHKYCRLTEVHNISTNIKTIELKVDDKNNLDYRVNLLAGSMSGSYQTIDADIKSENGEAYIFAAISSTSETLSTSSVNVMSNSATSIKTKSTTKRI